MNLLEIAEMHKQDAQLIKESSEIKSVQHMADYHKTMIQISEELSDFVGIERNRAELTNCLVSLGLMEAIEPEDNSLVESYTVSDDGRYVITAHSVVGGVQERPDISHVVADPEKAKSLGLHVSDEPGKYGKSTRMSVTDRKNDNISHFHVYQSDVSNGKPSFYVRGIGGIRPHDDSHRSVLVKHMSEHLNEEVIIENNDSYDSWKNEIEQTHPQHRGTVRYVGFNDPVHGACVNAHVPGADKSLGVYTLSKDSGHVLTEAKETHWLYGDAPRRGTEKYNIWKSKVSEFNNSTPPKETEYHYGAQKVILKDKELNEEDGMYPHGFLKWQDDATANGLSIVKAKQDETGNLTQTYHATDKDNNIVGHYSSSANGGILTKSPDEYKTKIGNSFNDTINKSYDNEVKSLPSMVEAEDTDSSDYRVTASGHKTRAKHAKHKSESDANKEDPDDKKKHEESFEQVEEATKWKTIPMGHPTHLAADPAHPRHQQWLDARPEPTIKQKEKELPSKIDQSSREVFDALENHLGGSFEHYESDPRHGHRKLADGTIVPSMNATVTQSYDPREDLGYDEETIKQFGLDQGGEKTAETYHVNLIKHPTHGIIVSYGKQIHESFEQVEEGWMGSAGGQKEASNALWDSLFDKHKDNPDVSKHLKDLRVYNWKPEYAESEAIKLSKKVEESIQKKMVTAILEDDIQSLKTLTNILLDNKTHQLFDFIKKEAVK